jgi:hypothetical protein
LDCSAYSTEIRQIQEIKRDRLMEPNHFTTISAFWLGSGKRRLGKVELPRDSGSTDYPLILGLNDH